MYQELRNSTCERHWSFLLQKISNVDFKHSFIVPRNWSKRCVYYEEMPTVFTEDDFSVFFNFWPFLAENRWWVTGRGLNIVEIHRRSCRVVRASTSRASARISGRMNRAPPSAFSNQDWPTINWLVRSIRNVSRALQTGRLQYSTIV